jgi:hypothetical protein
MPRFISNELFHFVGRSNPKNHEINYLKLKKVIESGGISHPPHDPGYGATQIQVNTSKALVSEELIIPTVTCYCDIPFESLDLHLQKYGHFGIAFSKDFVIKEGARPAIYIPLHPSNWGSPYGLSLLNDIESVYKGYRTQILSTVDSTNEKGRYIGAEPTSLQEAIIALDSVLSKDFIAFIKPFDSQLPDDHPNYYYAEREWRKYGNLIFEPSKVTRIVVDRSYLKRARMELPAYVDKIYAAPVKKSWLVKLVERLRFLVN